ncbi:hypothetical protein [Paenibacillus sp. LHD-38]|uniref:hypothetical protein n=1 Tax=Paenibacillus sp. LHD-38 TaxID=3072143 RepID=UPI0028102361|nr:hypothetical protein [Paenibacillus sp. LHD-38]MDQ8738589.1 hypothetical protein [Paenibacillus sp. LHD-38]
MSRLDPDKYDRRAARDEALEILERRNVLTKATAAKARALPLGSAAEALPKARRPRKELPRIKYDPKASDPGGILGAVLILTAPFLYLLTQVGLGLGWTMWIVTLWLFVGLLGIGIPKGSIPRSPSRLSRGMGIFLGFAGLVTPITTIVISLVDLVHAPKFFGALIAYQGMTAWFIFICGLVIEKPAHKRSKKRKP